MSRARMPRNRFTALAAALAAAALGLGGCATRDVAFHAMPPETPAADNAAAIVQRRALEAAIAAAERARAEAQARTAPISAPTATGEAGPPLPAAAPEPLTAADAPSMTTYDPWERLNRFTYRFNARVDRAVFLPIANGYRRLPPSVRAGVHNFFGNLAEIDYVVDYALQGRLGRSARSLGRFVINSTAGLGGLIDVARRVPLPRAPTTFSDTLATWGLHPGPYLVLPLLGPSTLRDGVGLLGDYGTLYGLDPLDLYGGPASWPLGVTNAVDQRANVDFRYYSTGSPFEYEIIRFLYVRKRLIEDEGLHPNRPPRPPSTNRPAGE